MRLLVSLCFLSAVAVAAEEMPAEWAQLLGSVELSGSREIHVARFGEPASPDWPERVRNGGVVILEGESGLAASFGFRPSKETVTVTSLRDVHQPSVRIVLEKPIKLSRWNVPAGAVVFTTERWTGAAIVAGYRSGKGAVLWVAMSPGKSGYERFPFLIHALADLGVDPPYRSNRLWAFFDYSYRIHVDVNYFARRWREAGISALHVAAWHFYDQDSERDAYLRALIEACHREGVLVYAWLELPHVSEEFWDRHPEWREKTAVLQDAHLDWRKLMNLANPACARTVKQGVKDLIFRFDWDGVNLAELYYESLEGASNPSRFTPMNSDIRSAFQATPGGFDPMEIWSTRRDPASLRRFLDFRAERARAMQEEWLGEVVSYRDRKPDLDVVLTHVDDRFDTGMRDAIGADAARVLPLLKKKDFTFLIEDPATVWNLGPQRYPDIARRYQPLTPFSDQLGIDINVVDRYQDVYPTKQQSGTELFELLHVASKAFARVALYFENSILPADFKFLSAAAAIPGPHSASGYIEAPPGFGFHVGYPVLVDGKPWPVRSRDTVWLPVGRHSIQLSSEDIPVHVSSFNGTLVAAGVTGTEIELEYTCGSRATATLDRTPSGIRIDGIRSNVPVFAAGEFTTVLLPRGRHRVTIESSTN